MTHYFARSRRSRGAYLDALLAHQAEEAGVSLAELREYDEAAQAPGAPAVLVVVDQPAPARGYALLAPLGDDRVAVRLYVLPSQPDDVYRALFSAVVIQGRGLRPDAALLVDTEALDPRTRDAIERLGGPYGLSVSAEAELPMPTPSGPISEGTAEQLTSGSVTIEAVQDPSAEPISEAAEPEEPEAEPEPTEAVQDTETVLVCEDCGRTFGQARYLTQHRKAKHEA